MHVLSDFFAKKAGFFGFCDTFPATALNRLFRILLMLAAKQIRTQRQMSLQRLWSWLEIVQSGYQRTDCSRHMNAKHVKCSYLDKLISSRCFKSLNELPDQIDEVEMIKTFLSLSSCTPNLQCCSLNTSFSPLFAIQKNEFIGTDTDSLFVALSGENLDKISRPELRSLWYWMMQSDCSDNFAGKSRSNFSYQNFTISMLP